ncbi:MAG: hypothetical protein NUV80_04630 [Candidatus Berkelbacteria bacterium]|nr:hypothetical protein [Candidatus Berkelbacteria bacterium]
MSNKKTLSIKRVFAWSIYNNLKNTPPKDYSTTGEIKSTIVDILPVLKIHISEYISMMKEAEDLSVQVASKKLSEDEAKTAVDKINDAWKVYNKASGDEIVALELDEEGFNTLKTQFDREGWGKKWLANIEEFGELLEAFDAAK